MNNNIFIVEQGKNTSYIDSLIIALFYKISHLQEIITQIPNNNEYIYLQEIINTNFIEKIRSNNSVNISIINEIRNYSYICGWKNGLDITELYNVLDYMKFLMSGIGFGTINFEIIEYKINIKKSDYIINTLETNCLEVDINKNISIKKLLNKWIYLNIKKNKDLLINFKFAKIPLLISIYLNRNQQEINNYEVDIMQKIRFKNIDKNLYWTIHSIICFSNLSKSYYSIVNTLYNDWYLFSNIKIPSFNKINITDDLIAHTIKKECVLILYKLDGDICKY
jgi:hypothetical protein